MEEESAFNPRRYAHPGGRMPAAKQRGPGAPPGNMNALKHGRNSKQLAELGALLASDPTIRATLLGIGRRRSLKEHNANQIAAHLLTNLLAHADRKARGQLNLRIPTDVLNSIAEAGAEIDPDRYAQDTKLQRNPKNNSTPNETPGNQ